MNVSRYFCTTETEFRYCDIVQPDYYTCFVEVQKCLSESADAQVEPEWTKQDETKLCHSVKIHQGHNWLQVGVEQELRHSALSCFRHYQQFLSAHIHHTEWEEFEDLCLINCNRSELPAVWQNLVNFFPGRFWRQCELRWGKLERSTEGNKVCNWRGEEETLMLLTAKALEAPLSCQSKLSEPAEIIISGRWRGEDYGTAEEDGEQRSDGRLEAYRKCLWNSMEHRSTVERTRQVRIWEKMSSIIATKSASQCSDKWTTTLDPTVRHNSFTEAEDLLLHNEVEINGTGVWSKIAPRFPGRTAEQLRNRWLHSATLSAKTVACTKRCIQPSSFGREKKAKITLRNVRPSVRLYVEREIGSDY